MRILAWPSVLTAGLLVAQPVCADFNEAYKKFVAGDYSQAREEFLALAELGSGAAQFNLGAMSLNGQGTSKNEGEGVGWLLAAAENSYQNMPPEKLAALRAGLSEADNQAAQRILLRYGREGMQQRVLPTDTAWESICPNRHSPELLKAGPLEYSPADRRNAFATVAVTVGLDGRARDPQVLSTNSLERFIAAAVESAMKASYKAATRDGVPVEDRVTTRFAFTMNSAAVPRNNKVLEEVTAMANAEDPAAQYILGIAGSVDSSLGIPNDKVTLLLLKSAQGGYASAQYAIAHKLQRRAECGVERGKSLIWMKQAAVRGNGPAQVSIASALSPTASASEIAAARAMLESAAQSTDYYARKHAVEMLAAAAIPGLRNSEAALNGSTAMLKGAIRVDPQVYEVAAAAHAASGDFQGAATHQQAALGKAKRLGWNTSLIEERLGAYLSNRTWAGDLFVVPPK